MNPFDAGVLAGMLLLVALRLLRLAVHTARSGETIASSTGGA